MIFPKSSVDATMLTKNHTVDSRYLYPVLKAEELLAHSKRQQLLKKIQEQSLLTGSDYEQVYESLINRFVEFVQLLPSVPNGRIAGLIEDGLLRANFILQAYQKTENELDPLYTFAIFSLALLQDIGKVISQQVIMITDEQGNYIDEWAPFEGSMHEIGDYYKARLLGGQWIKLGQSVTPLLARQLIPEVAFLWLADDYPLLQMWLAALNGDSAGSGSFQHLLTLCAQRLAEYRSEKVSLPVINVNILEPADINIGEDFLNWLTQGLEDNSILVNQPEANVHIVDDGVFLQTPKIFQEYCLAKKQRVEPARVNEEFNRLGLVRTDKYNKKNRQYVMKQLETKNANSSSSENNRYLLNQKNIRHKQSQQFAKKATFSEAVSQLSKKIISNNTKKLFSSSPAKNKIKEGIVIHNPHLVFVNKPVPAIDYNLQTVEVKQNSKLNNLQRLIKKLAMKLTISTTRKRYIRLSRK